MAISSSIVLDMYRRNKLNILLRQRCRHNMIVEYCGVCQKVEYLHEYGFPVDKKDKETGKKIGTYFLKGKTKHVKYRSYR